MYGIIMHLVNPIRIGLNSENAARSLNLTFVKKKKKPRCRCVVEGIRWDPLRGLQHD